jgi:carbamoyltransferase
MIIGIKCTHDGGVAIIDGDRLLASVEMEKIGNAPRHMHIASRQDLHRLIAKACEVAGLPLAATANATIVLDGWNEKTPPEYHISLAQYHEASYGDVPLNPLEASWHWPPDLDGWLINRSYASYTHTTGHILGTYMCWPGAEAGEPAHVLVWDGHPGARLYSVTNERVVFCQQITGLAGWLYGAAALYLGEQRQSGDHEAVYADIKKKAEATRYPTKGRRDAPGKMMAYLGMAKPYPLSVVDRAMEVYQEFCQPGHPFAIVPDKAVASNDFDNALCQHEFLFTMVKLFRDHGLDEDPQVMHAFHTLLGRVLLEGLRPFVNGTNSLLFTGGCALNIKWNSMLREELTRSIWVPPFPNDSGSALGVAAVHAWKERGVRSLQWSPYCGPLFDSSGPAPGCRVEPMTLERLVLEHLINDEPVLMLDGPAEIGPRALGNRSIIASPGSAEMKDILNRMKGREHWRPVAPICLEEEAPHLFSPGSADPYMLFEHYVNLDWADRVPAIVHIDGTARLQTVNEEQNPTIYHLLCHWHAHSGLPVLCNTSANFNGSGFFPDLQSAIQWARGAGVKTIWSGGNAYHIRPGT